MKNVEQAYIARSCVISNARPFDLRIRIEGEENLLSLKLTVRQAADLAQNLLAAIAADAEMHRS